MQLQLVASYSIIMTTMASKEQLPGRNGTIMVS